MNFDCFHFTASNYKRHCLQQQTHHHRSSSSKTQLTIPRLAMDLKQSISNQTDVALAIARHLSLDEGKDSNLVFCPLSLHVVVSLIAAGATGPTLDQLLTFLNKKSVDDVNKLSSELVSVVLTDGSHAGGPNLSSANGMWVEQTLPLNHSFKRVVDHYYKAASYQVDFRNNAMQVLSEVNSWAEKETNGLIKDVLPPGSVDNFTELIFANALYFKGSWIERFEASNTTENDFHLLHGDSVKVPFMTKHEPQCISVFGDYAVLGLPYAHGGDKRQFSMYIFLPHTRDGLPALWETVGSEPGFLDRHLPVQEICVAEVKLPRFKISFGFDASDTLKKMGVTLPFLGGGLTGMVDPPTGDRLYVSSINQKSFIEVNEEGTEAASSTAAVINSRIAPIIFVADHPFLFLIREDTTGAVLFVGHVLNPLEE